MVGLWGHLASTGAGVCDAVERTDVSHAPQVGLFPSPEGSSVHSRIVCRTTRRQTSLRHQPRPGIYWAPCKLREVLLGRPPAFARPTRSRDISFPSGGLLLDVVVGEGPSV